MKNAKNTNQELLIQEQYIKEVVNKELKPFNVQQIIITLLLTALTLFLLYKQVEEQIFVNQLKEYLEIFRSNRGI